MTRLSVNVNKIATLRNARGGNLPNLVQVAKDCEYFGAQGITVHPRPDERHIRYADVPDLKEGQDIITPLDKPIKDSGHIRILKGNFAPEGSVAKITGKEGLSFSGPARVFDSEEDMIKALEENKIENEGNQN